MKSQPTRKTRLLELILRQVSLECAANRGFSSQSTRVSGEVVGSVFSSFSLTRNGMGRLDSEQTYQVSYQDSRDERSNRNPCQACNRSYVERPIVHLVNLPFDSINRQEFIHKSFAQRSLSHSFKLTHCATMSKSDQGRFLSPYLLHLLVKAKEWNEEEEYAWHEEYG